ncbi:putative uncharacterized protein DDB_G0271606 [Anopheles ziemanni]|uniref:putative uncharacterized protein DDB_G0271606 n=1 Tax=Anopheles coustani TaxID=139045 RepID=UPI00265B4C2C|nr:putative uncharacterized protein DDB_G0271606 [Anopheles coustani]XP_058177792.1 putative uncharacterized protein DDB_G0271606 [Anopheles ziemanni]
MEDETPRRTLRSRTAKGEAPEDKLEEEPGRVLDRALRSRSASVSSCQHSKEERSFFGKIGDRLGVLLGPLPLDPVSASPSGHSVNNRSADVTIDIESSDEETSEHSIATPKLTSASLSSAAASPSPPPATPISTLVIGRTMAMDEGRTTPERDGLVEQGASAHLAASSAEPEAHRGQYSGVMADMLAVMREESSRNATVIAELREMLKELRDDNRELRTQVSVLTQQLATMKNEQNEQLAQTIKQGAATINNLPRRKATSSQQKKEKPAPKEKPQRSQQIDPQQQSKPRRENPDQQRQRSKQQQHPHGQQGRQQQQEKRQQQQEDGFTMVGKKGRPVDNKQGHDQHTNQEKPQVNKGRRIDHQSAPKEKQSFASVVEV